MGRRLTKYQVLLLDSPKLMLKVCQTLTVATLTLEVAPENQNILHSYFATIEQVFSSRPDLKDIALGNPNVEQFIK